LTDTDDRVLVHCHGGHTLEQIAAAIGLTPADFFDKTERRGRDLVVDTYVYTDAEGRPLYRKHRTAAKRFWQERYENGHWKPKLLPETPRVLYHLPALLAAVKRGDRIYIVEGERDVHAAETSGATATCNDGGAGSNKWRLEHTATLAGADEIVIVADKDAPGYRHAREIYRVLTHASVARSLIVVQALTGKDTADHLGAGHSLEQLEVITDELNQLCGEAAGSTQGGPEVSVTDTPAYRGIILTPASSIQIRPVRWLMQDRIALGTLALLAGREGVGKSTLAYQLAADVTRGRLQGVYHGEPKAVIVAATEDSWEHTIVPRLMAADADLDRVYRVEVRTAAGFYGTLNLPADLPDLRARIADVDAAFVVLDPFISRLDANLDTHRDAEVRQALEPLVAVTDSSGVALLGLIHLNKSLSTDPLTMLMASRAFPAVARAVLFVTVDPENESVRLVGLAKNNLGRVDLPALTFTISGEKVADTDEGPIWTGKIVWLGETDRSIADVLRMAAEAVDVRTATADAEAWLREYLTLNQVVSSGLVKKDGKAADHSESALKRARQNIGAGSTSYGFPRITYWSKPGLNPDQVDRLLAELAQSARPSRTSHGESDPTELTGPTGPSDRSRSSGTSGTSGTSLPGLGPTGGGPL
jgi:5S rRNA maturation endonuclease (ribonuclease M5)